MRQQLKHDLGERVSIWWDYDQENIEGSFDFGDEKENAEYLEKFRTGEYVSLALEVQYYDRSGNVSGSDYLGACHFVAKNLDAQILETVSEYYRHFGD